MPCPQFPLGPFTPYAENPILRPQGDGYNGLILLLHNAAVKFDDGTMRYTCGQLGQTYSDAG